MRSGRSSVDRLPPIEQLESRQLLAASAAVVSAPAVVLPNHIAPIAVRVTNTGPGAAPTEVRLFASPTRTVSSDSILLATSNPIAAGRRTVRLRVPSAATVLGTFYLVAQVIPADGIGASVLTAAASPHRTKFIAPTVDLQAAFVREPIGQVYVDATDDTRTYAVVRIANAGSVPAVGKITASIYRSSSTTFDSSAIVVGSVSVEHVRIAAGAARVVEVPITFKAGTAFGGYSLFAKIDASLSVAETTLANNLVRSPATIVISQAAPVHHRHHHHGGGGGGGDIIGVIGVDDPGDYSDDGDGSSDGSDPGYPVDDGGGGGGGATPPTDSGPTTQPDPPTSQPDPPTSQPSGNDGGGSSDSSDSGDSGGGSDSNDAESDFGSGDITDSGGSGSDFLVRAQAAHISRHNPNPR